MKMPEARLRILFVPFFDFSAQAAVIGIIVFDLCGLLFRFRLFDHAAHLGGSLFGMLVILDNSLHTFRSDFMPYLASILSGIIMATPSKTGTNAYGIRKMINQ